MNSKLPIVIDLFCGSGGLSLGFKRAGFKTVVANDISQDAINTIKLNNPETEIILKDIRELKSSEIKRILKTKGYTCINGIIGGPPCRGFSLANRKRNLENPGNHLFEEYLRLVRELKPDFFVFENVATILAVGNGIIKDTIYNEMKKIGYEVEIKVLTASDYGVPQVRQRAIIIGNRKGAKGLHPVPILDKDSYITVKQAIDDLPPVADTSNPKERDYLILPLSDYQELMRKNSNKVFNHIITSNNELVLMRYKTIPQGGNWRNIPKSLMKNYKNPELCHSNIYKRLSWDKPSITISNFRKSMLIHPEQHRGLTVREAARIQSFPDDYIITGGIMAQQQQIADAVPPLMAEAIALRIKTKLYPKEKKSKSKNHSSSYPYIRSILGAEANLA